MGGAAPHITAPHQARVRTFQGAGRARECCVLGFQETRFGRHQYQIGQMVSLPPCSNHQLLLGVSRDLLEALALMPRRECIKKWGIRFVPYLGARGD